MDKQAIGALQEKIRPVGQGVERPVVFFPATRLIFASKTAAFASLYSLAPKMTELPIE